MVSRIILTTCVNVAMELGGLGRIGVEDEDVHGLPPLHGEGAQPQGTRKKLMEADSPTTHLSTVSRVRMNAFADPIGDCRRKK